MFAVYERARQRERATAAIERTRALWPGVHGQALRDEIRSAYALLPWLGPTSRTVRLIDRILDQPESEEALAPN